MDGFLFLLIILFLLLLLPVWNNIGLFIRGLFVYLLCLDIIKRPYNEKTIDILIKHLSIKDYAITRRLILRSYAKDAAKLLASCKTDWHYYNDEFRYCNGEKGFALPPCIALRNILLADPALLVEIEGVIVMQHPSVVLDFAAATKDIGFSRKKLFVAVSKGSARYRDQFIQLFGEDKELKKLVSLM